MLLLGPDLDTTGPHHPRAGGWSTPTTPTTSRRNLSTLSTFRSISFPSTSSAESLTLREALGGGIQEGTNVTLVVVEKEAMSSPSSFKMKVVGTAVWLVRSSTCSVHLITMSRWVLVNHPKVAADLPGLVLHQGDVEPLERGGGELPGKRNYLQKVLKPLKNLCASTGSVETATR